MNQWSSCQRLAVKVVFMAEFESLEDCCFNYKRSLSPFNSYFNVFSSQFSQSVPTVPDRSTDRARRYVVVSADRVYRFVNSPI